MKKRENKALTVRLSERRIAQIGQNEEENFPKRRFGIDFSYLFGALLTAGIALASLGLVVYFGYHLVRSFTPDVTTAPAYEIVENEYRRGTGYIFRSEQTLTASLRGTPDHKVEDGTRVGVDELICDIYSSVTDEARAEIEAIDREIALLESIIDTGVVQTGIPEALRAADEAYAQIMSCLARGEYTEADALKDQLRVSLNRINWLEGGREDLKSKISLLLARRSGIIATYGKKTGSINAESIGYFYRNCDGYESVFDPALLSDITVGGFAELINSEPEASEGCVGKLISDPQWYLCVPFGASDAKGFEEGRKYNIILNDDSAKKIEMELWRIVPDLDDHDGDGDRAESVLIFSSKEMPAIKYLRAQDVSIEAASYRGYRIPLSAVRHYDGMTGVYTQSGGYVFFRQIKIIYEGPGYCIAADYAEAEPGRPETYTVLGFSDRGAVNDYASLHAYAENLGWEREVYDNGGIPLVKDSTLRYFYHLDDLEQVILTGKGLYHGKALD